MATAPKKETKPEAPKAESKTTTKKAAEKAPEPKWVTTNDGVKIGHVPG